MTGATLDYGVALGGVGVALDYAGDGVALGGVGVALDYAGDGVALGG